MTGVGFAISVEYRKQLINQSIIQNRSLGGVNNGIIS